MNWLRLYHEVISDPKWPAVARRAQTNQGTVVSVWVALLIYASQQDERGSVDGFCATDCDALYGYDDGTCQRVIDALKERGVIQDGKLAAWDKRQPKRERETDETSTERVRKYRQARAVTSCNANETALKHHETPCNANENHETPPDKDKIKIREDKDYYDAREKGGVGEKETQPPVEEAASPDTPSGSMAQPQEPEPEELVLSAAPAEPPAPSKPQPVSAQAIADLWNRMMPERGFARVTRVTNQRAAHRPAQRDARTHRQRRATMAGGFRLLHRERGKTDPAHRGQIRQQRQRRLRMGGLPEPAAKTGQSGIGGAESGEKQTRVAV